MLLLLLTLAVVAGVAAVAAGLVSGGMDDPTSTVPARELPPGPVRRQDVVALRFVPAFRGYRMDQVDAAMDRLGDEIDRLRAEVAERDRRLAASRAGGAGEFDPAPAEPGAPEPGAPQPGARETSAPVGDRPGSHA
jgi:DivIVA domain-containing protein